MTVVETFKIVKSDGDEDIGMFEIVNVDGKSRFALRDGLTTNDLFAVMERQFNERVIAVVKEAKRRRI